LWEVGEGEKQYIMKSLEKAIVGEVEMEVGGKETLNKCGSCIYIYRFIPMTMEVHGARCTQAWYGSFLQGVCPSFT
jgi:hypothetical protein